MLAIQVFATGIKAFDRQKLLDCFQSVASFLGKEATLCHSNPQKHEECCLTGTSVGPQKETIKQFLPIKSLDPGCKHLNRQHVSDYPLVLYMHRYIEYHVAEITCRDSKASISGLMFKCVE